MTKNQTKPIADHQRLGEINCQLRSIVLQMLEAPREVTSRPAGMEVLTIALQRVHSLYGDLAYKMRTLAYIGEGSPPPFTEADAVRDAEMLEDVISRGGDLLAEACYLLRESHARLRQLRDTPSRLDVKLERFLADRDAEAFEPHPKPCRTAGKLKVFCPRCRVGVVGTGSGLCPDCEVAADPAPPR